MSSGRRALIIGINAYPTAPLSCCVNDATSLSCLLATNEDGSKNFDVKTPTSLEDVNLSNLTSQAQTLFGAPVSVALFYFSGHGAVVDGQAYLCSLDFARDKPGLRMEDLMRFADSSSAKINNRIIILDCCFSGNAGNRNEFNQAISNAQLTHGTTILTASRENQSAKEDAHLGVGIFTNLVLDALRGGAADILGRITPASIYSHVDQSLGEWDQRPLFKSHVDEFLVLRRVATKVSIAELQTLPSLFNNPDALYSLTPEHEHTNQDGSQKTGGDQRLHQEFRLLQRLNRHGLVVPNNYEDMYWAAMNNESCRLTRLGQHYWKLAKENKLS